MSHLEDIGVQHSSPSMSAFFFLPSLLQLFLTLRLIGEDVDFPVMTDQSTAAETQHSDWLRVSTASSSHGKKKLLSKSCQQRHSIGTNAIIKRQFDGNIMSI